MTVNELTEKYKKYENFKIRPKPGLEEVHLGRYIIPIQEKEYRAHLTQCREDASKLTIFVLAKGRRNRGWFASDIEQVLEQFDVVMPKTSKGDKWLKDIKRAINCLNQSGLWPDIMQFFIDLSMVDYEDREQIKILYRNDEFARKRVNCDSYNVYEYNNYFRDYYGDFITDYPFMFEIDGKGYMYLNTQYIQEMSECKLKSMYFGKYRNEQYKNDIEEAIKNGNEISRRALTSYDVSFTYKPAEQKAWYSEEYRNTGNGHYYLALNHSTALFCEND